MTEAEIASSPNPSGELQQQQPGDPADASYKRFVARQGSVGRMAREFVRNQAAASRRESAQLKAQQIVAARDAGIDIDDGLTLSARGEASRTQKIIQERRNESGWRSKVGGTFTELLQGNPEDPDHQFQPQQHSLATQPQHAPQAVDKGPVGKNAAANERLPSPDQLMTYAVTSTNAKAPQQKKIDGSASKANEVDADKRSCRQCSSGPSCAIM